MAIGTAVLVGAAVGIDKAFHTLGDGVVADRL